MKAFITGTGMYVPERVVTNEEIADELGVRPERIYKASGIRRRHWVANGTKTSTLAARALRAALEDARITPTEVDFLVLGTMTPDRFIPGTSPAVQKLLGMNQIGCLDIRATCCNTLYGLQLARSLVVSGVTRKVALCFADIQSPWLDISETSGTTSMLFGDGGSALIVSSASADSGHGLQIIDVMLRTDGSYTDALGIRSPGTEFGNKVENPRDFMPRMDGTKVLLRASRSMAAVCRSLLQRYQLTPADVRWIVPHQANANVLRQVMRALGIARHPERLVNVLEEYGNTSSASMVIALDTLRRSGRIAKGDYVLLPAFGAGFTWGAALCRA